MARASYPAANEFIAAYEGSQVPKVTWDRTDSEGKPSLLDLPQQC